MCILGVLASPTSSGLVQPSKDLQCFATCSLAAKKSVKRHQSEQPSRDSLCGLLFFFGLVWFRFALGVGGAAVLTVLVFGNSCCCCGGCASAKSSFCYGNVATKVHVAHCRRNLCSMLSSCPRDLVPGLWQVTYLALDGAIGYSKGDLISFCFHQNHLCFD